MNDSLLAEMLDERDDFELILPYQAYSLMSSKSNLSKHMKRIHSIELDTAETTHLTIGEINLNIARSKHANSYETENLCYIINDYGFRILHTGDCRPESIEDIKTDFFRDIDLAIIPAPFGQDGFKVYGTVLKPRYTIISHIKKDMEDRFKEIIKTDPETFSNKDVLFESMDQKSYKR